MFGANKPPWIDKIDFYQTPFNFCDRLCERCQLTDYCKVFKDSEKSKQKYIKQGKDPYSWECVFESVGESLAKAMMLLAKDAKRMGIDLDKIDDSDYQPPPRPKEFPLYSLANKFSKRLDVLLKDLEMVPVDADEKLILENRDIISHYRFLILGKIYRALTSGLEERKFVDDLTFDSKTSAFIASNGLLSISDALTSLAKHKPLHLLKKKFLHSAKISLDLAQTLELKFLS